MTTAEKTYPMKVKSVVDFSYAGVEAGAVAKVATHAHLDKLGGRDEGRAKHINALVLQSVGRHGPNVPLKVVYGEVWQSARKSGLYGNPLLILLLPMLIQFIQQMAPVILQYIIDLLGKIKASSGGGDTVFKSLADQAATKWKL